MFQLPGKIPGKSWFRFLCQLRPKVAEVSQLFASEARSWEPGSWRGREGGGGRLVTWEVQGLWSETPTTGSASWAQASVSPSSQWTGWFQSCWLHCVSVVFHCPQSCGRCGLASTSVCGRPGEGQGDDWRYAWVCGWDLTPSHSTLWVLSWGVPGASVPSDVLSAMFVQKMPLLTLLVFPSLDPLPPAVQAHLSQGLTALTSLLEIKADFQEAG